MHLYKHFWKLLRSNLIGLVLYSGIMVIMIAMVGILATSQFDKPVGDEQYTKPVDISYIDDDESELSRGLIEYLGARNNLSDYSGVSQDRINDLVYFTITSYHIEIPSGFQDMVDDGQKVNIEYMTNAGNSSSTYSLTSEINSYIMMYSAYVNIGMEPSEATSKVYENLTREHDISVYTSDEEYTGSTAKEWGLYEVSIYCVYLTLGMVMLSAGFVLIKSGDARVKSRIGASPQSVLKLTITDTAGLYSFGILVWAFLVVLMYIVCGDTNLVRDRGMLMALVLLVTVLVNCSMTAFVTSFNIKSNALSMLCNIIGLSMSFLSGVFVPQWLLAENVLNFGRLIPFYWAVRAINIIYTESGAGLTFDFGQIMKCMGIEILFMAVFVFLAILVRKTKRV